jgi:hypothetical protein
MPSVLSGWYTLPLQIIGGGAFTNVDPGRQFQFLIRVVI